VVTRDAAYGAIVVALLASLLLLLVGGFELGARWIRQVRKFVRQWVLEVERRPRDWW